MVSLYDIRMIDGSRQFADIPETVFFDAIRNCAAKLEGAIETGFVSDWVTEMWLDFDFRGHSFSVNNQFGEYWFFVRDPACSDEILFDVISHFEKLI